MKGYLESIEVSNFKSYSGTTIIKFKPFTAVVGPNGSGKSNLMDAISFVLGEKTSHLRGHKVTDLIYGANTGRPQSSNATVTATYINEDGVKSTFTRMVKGNSTEFKYNGSVVSSIEYKRAIQSINVFVKEKNFLVYQGEVPNIATKSPKEITQLVEEISGSVSFKQEYDDLKKELEKGETEVMLAHQAMRDVRVNRKKVKSEEKKDREREALIDQYDQDVLELGLLELFYNNKGIDGVKSNGSELKQESIDLKMKLEPLESELKGAKKSQGKILRQVSVLEKKLSSMDTEKTDKTSTYIKAKQLTASESDKLKSLTKQIDNIKKSLDIRNNTKKDLESQMSSLKSEVKNEEDELKKLSMSTVLGLSKAQESEYTSLQQTLDQQSMLTENEIEKIESEIITNQENMEALKRQQTNILLVRNQASLELKEQTTRLDNLNNDIKYSGERIIDLKEKIDTLEKSDPATKILEINAEIEELHISEETMRLSEYEKNKLEKQQEVSAKLKQKFPGVLGRLCEFVTPIHPRYELAVTRVLGPHFKSILCDKLTTAQECIRYMKEQRMERETFLAFDFLKTKPTNLSLRDIRDPPGVKLAIDVIKYDSNNNVVNSAVQFVCRDTLVCETVDDAREVAYGHNERQQSLEKVLLKKTSNELELSKLKEERHLLYQNCKMNAINLRLLQGSLHSGSGDGDDSSSNGFASQSHTQATAEKEDRIKVDFSCLSDELKTLENASEVSKKIKNMKVNLANKKHIVDNMIVFGSKGEVVNEKFKQAKETLDERTQAVKTIKQRFDEVKKNRHEAFTKCMQFLTTKVSDIYKELTQNQAAQADLYPDNTEEPYLDGLRYFCVAPGKRYLNMEDLSGGEKTLVALALLFAIHAFKPSPFFVVDEIDAALDNTNIGKVVHYIKLISQEVQCIVISLKQEFYSEADALVGIYGQKISNNKCSGVLSVDISNL